MTTVTDIDRADSARRLKWFAGLAATASVFVYSGLGLSAGVGGAAIIVLLIGAAAGISANAFLVRGCYAIGSVAVAGGRTRWPSFALWALLNTAWIGVSMIVGGLVLSLF